MRAAMTAVAAIAAVIALVPCAAPLRAQEIISVYTRFDAGKTCKHKRGRDAEDYGSWTCPGHGGLIVHLSAGDQRMQVSFGGDARSAARERAARQTFPSFNSVYRGTVEWRAEKTLRGGTRPFATILRWSVMTPQDQERADGRSTGAVLVVTRLNPGGVCHVGYVDARGADANATARRLADETARGFRCDSDEPVRR